LTWGAGYRHARDESRAGALARLVPDDMTLRWAHLFVEDQIALTPRVTLDLGVRLDSNSYTGVEVLPSARLAWRQESGALWWGALSRAVRSPSRFDRDFHFPATEPYIIRGGPGFESETSEVAELGWRAQPTDWLSLSVTGFHHWYDDLRGGEPSPDGGLVIANRVEGRVYGVEGWARVRLPRRWEVGLGFLELRKDLQLQPGFQDGAAIRGQGNDPEHQWLLRASTRLGERQRLSAFARYVGALPDPHIPSYLQVDARWSFNPTAHTELGIGVNNLFDERHTELQPSGGLAASEFGRSVFVDVRVGW
jgi:iron complex outermembrane receptor protein